MKDGLLLEKLLSFKISMNMGRKKSPGGSINRIRDRNRAQGDVRSGVATERKQLIVLREKVSQNGGGNPKAKNDPQMRVRSTKWKAIRNERRQVLIADLTSVILGSGSSIQTKRIFDSQVG